MEQLHKTNLVETSHATLLPFLVLLILLLLLLPSFRRKSHPNNLLPSPRRLPIIGHLHLLLNLPHQSFYHLSQRLGPIFSLSLGSIPCIVACSSSAAREFLKTHDASFPNRPFTKAVSILTYGSSNFSFAPYGSFWRFTKHLYMMELFSSRTLEQFRPIRRDEIRRLLDDVRAKAKKGEPIDLGVEMTKMTYNVTTRMAVSRHCHDGTKAEAEEAIGLVMQTTELLGKFNLADYLWFCRSLNLQGFDNRLQELHQKFDGLMERIMKQKEGERRKRGGVNQNEDNSFEVKDLLDILMDISEDERAEVKLTRDNVKAFIRVSSLGYVC